MITFGPDTKRHEYAGEIHAPIQAAQVLLWDAYDAATTAAHLLQQEGATKHAMTAAQAAAMVREIGNGLTP
jgi:hypothetical protein